MSDGQGGADEAKWLRWRSVAELYHACFTGLILCVATRRGTTDAAEFVFRVFRRQQQERFLPGLEKLGLSHLPPAVAAAPVQVTQPPAVFEPPPGPPGSFSGPPPGAPPPPSTG